MKRVLTSSTDAQDHPYGPCLWQYQSVSQKINCQKVWPASLTYIAIATAFHSLPSKNYKFAWDRLTDIYTTEPTSPNEDDCQVHSAICEI